jgi:sugar phosphate permease
MKWSSTIPNLFYALLALSFRLYSNIRLQILIDWTQDRRLKWQLDLRFLPWLSFLYLCSFLDRTNIGNAKIDGLQEDLGMTNNQFNAALTIFFVSYAIFEPLSNVLLKQARPSLFIPTIMILWVRILSVSSE